MGLPLSPTGHQVSLYERYDFAGEVGASLSCAKNGSMWLEEWKVSDKGKDILQLLPLSGEIACRSDCGCSMAARAWLIACPRMLHQIGVADMHPVVLKSLCMHDYETGEPINDYDLSDYKEKWGHEYYMFHRQDMHKGLLKAATSEEGEGPPARLYVNHRAAEVDPESGRVKFTNGREIQADLIIGSDGIRSAVRQFIGVE